MLSVKNPIMTGFFPDPSICRVGNKFYTVHSTFAYFPGVPVFESEDLVHWNLISSVAAAKWGENVQPARSPPTNKKPCESAKSQADVGVWKPNLPDRYPRNPSILFPIANTKSRPLDSRVCFLYARFIYKTKHLIAPQHNKGLPPMPIPALDTKPSSRP